MRLQRDVFAGVSELKNRIKKVEIHLGKTQFPSDNSDSETSGQVVVALPLKPCLVSAIFCGVSGIKKKSYCLGCLRAHH